MTSEYHYPFKLLSLTIIVCALASNALLLKEYVPFAPGILENNPITVFEGRFDGLKEILPPDSVVGYAAGTSSSAIAGSMQYQHTQYALAPRIVLRDSTLQTVVVNSPDRNVVSEMQSKGYLIVQDFENGVVLMRKKGPR